MKTKVLLFALWGTLNAAAQLPTDFRSEQIYLNLHQTSYQPGDTLLLEGQVTCMADDRFLPYSNYLYIECFNKKDSVLVRQKVSCKDNGYFSTQLPTEYEWPSDVYYLRAYTRLMQNFSYDSFAQQPFLLGKEFPKKEERIYEARCLVAPSGGKLVAGYPQTVAVMLTNEATFPISAQLQLMSEKGDTLGVVQTSASGMAQLRFIPTFGLKYYLTSHIDGRDYQFPLPDATRDIKVQGSLNGKKLNFQILNGKETEKVLYTYDRLNGLTRTPVEKDNGILMLDEVPETVTLFLTDAANNILSEYTLSSKVTRESSIQMAEAIKANEAIGYELPITTEGKRVMTRIVAENDLLASSAEGALKYLADYASPLPFPQHLYATDEATFNNDLHAWLSTAKFKRFKLADALQKDTAMYVYAPEQVLSFSGKIEKTSKRPLKGGQLVAYHTEKDYVYDVSLDSDSARFVMAVDDFMEGENFFLQAITPKGKPDFANYKVDEEVYPALLNKRRFHLPTSQYADSEVIIGNTLNLSYNIDKDNERNYTLPNVTVKARVRMEKPKDTHEFYNLNFANRDKIEEKAYTSLYDILKDMPGIRVIQTSDTEQSYMIISSRGQATMTYTPLPLLIDGTRTMDYDFYLHIPAFELEYVKVLRAWEALKYTFGAIDGAILVKTRNYSQRDPLPSKGAMYSPTGLSPLSHPYKEMPASSLSCCKPGRYRLLVDVIDSEGIKSYEHSFEVVE